MARTDNEEVLLYRRALRKWGTDLQCIVLLEEMAELQKEVCKIYRYVTCGPDDILKLAEEVADVLIMLRQLMVAFDLADPVEYFKSLKLDRLEEMLRENEN